LKKVKSFLKGWGFNLVGIRRKRKKEIQEELMELEGMEEKCTLNMDKINARINLKSGIAQYPR
jgi:hypothetical protein